MTFWLSRTRQLGKQMIILKIKTPKINKDNRNTSDLARSKMLLLSQISKCQFSNSLHNGKKMLFATKIAKHNSLRAFYTVKEWEKKSYKD